MTGLIEKPSASVPMPRKKLLQVKTGEYLLDIREGAVATTYNPEVALDITDWRLEQFSFIVGNLIKVGYKPKAVYSDEIKTMKVDASEVKVNE